MRRLEGKVAIITGAGSGIGKATAILFAEHGAKIVVSDIRKDLLDETVEILETSGADVVSVKSDVSNEDDVRNIIHFAVSEFNAINVLINSAGISTRMSESENSNDFEVWKKVLAVNLNGTYLTSKYVVPEMKKIGNGSIINIASILSLVSFPKDGDKVGLKSGTFDAYPPSKGAVLQLTKNMAVQLASDGIRVNCICPGYTKTMMTKTAWTDPVRLKFLENLHPMGRMGNPEEIAYACLFLASDESSFITGIALPVDGGYTAQ